jgi:replication factor C small subunit
LAPDSAVWVEKYRPHSLAQMAGQENIVPLLRAYAERRSLPHLLFAGPPGTGKTTAALALAHDLYGDEWRQSLLELNASDERGIETVRTTIKGYARTAPLGGVPFKLLFLDEADNLTAEAQASLRRLMERYSAACRFILSCNYSSRIIEPIQSRCAVFRFRPLTPQQLRGPLERIAKAEHKTVEPEAVDAVITACDGDLRQAINLLQITSSGADRVTAAMVGAVVTTPLRSEVETMLSLALQGDFLQARERLYDLFAERGASGEDILRAIHSYVPDIPDNVVPPLAKVALVDYLGEVDYRLAEGASERLQLETILARLARDAEASRRPHGPTTAGPQ